MTSINFMFITDTKAAARDALLLLGWLIDNGPNVDEQEDYQRYTPDPNVNIDEIDEGFVLAHEWKDALGNVIQPQIIETRLHVNVRVFDPFYSEQVDGRAQTDAGGDLRSIFVRTKLGSQFKARLDAGQATVVAYTEEDAGVTQEMIDRYNALSDEQKKRILRTSKKVAPGIKYQGVTLLEDAPAFGGIATPRRVWA